MKMVTIRKKKMSDFNDFGFSTVSEDEYRRQQTTQVDTVERAVQ